MFCLFCRSFERVTINKYPLYHPEWWLDPFLPCWGLRPPSRPSGGCSAERYILRRVRGVLQEASCSLKTGPPNCEPRKKVRLCRPHSNVSLVDGIPVNSEIQGQWVVLSEFQPLYVPISLARSGYRDPQLDVSLAPVCLRLVTGCNGLSLSFLLVF